MKRDMFYSRKLKRLFISFILLSIATIVLTPIVIIATNSFMEKKELSDYIISYQNLRNTVNTEGDNYFLLKLIPQNFTLEQYYNTFIVKEYFLKMFWNSIIIVIPVIVGQLIISPMAAYSLAKIKFPFKNNIFLLYILVMLMPLQVTLVPNYIVLQKIGLINSFLAIILPGIFNPFGVFLLRQFIVLIPDDIIEAARIDGASNLTIFSSMIIPLCKPIIIALLSMSFADNWNIVEQPIIFLDDANKLPLSSALGIINANELDTAFAASVLYMIPALAVYYFGKSYLIEGLKIMNLKV